MLSMTRQMTGGARVAAQNGMTGMFSRALAVTAAVALAATVSLIAPAAQASSPPGVQLTGTQLASALLPVSYFPPGYQHAPIGNSGSRLEHGPARYSLNTMSCEKLVVSPPITGYGETAAAVAADYATGRSSTTGYLQEVYQFASPAAAAAYFQADHASYLRCWAGSAVLSGKTFTWTTQSVTKGYFGGHRAFYAHATTTLSGASASRAYAQIVLAGTDVFTVTASGTKVPARPAPAAVLASLITRVRG
jgi:hypothetical protein